MSFNHKHYVPCLRWKQGEYQALLNLWPDTKAFITPLIEVAEINFNFEKWEPAKTIDKHLLDFAKQVLLKWGTERCFIDSPIIDPDSLMNDGRHHVTYIFDDLVEKGINGIPVTGIDRTIKYNKAIKHIHENHNLDLCVRVKIEQAGRKDFNRLLDELLTYFGITTQNSDLVIDLGAPSFTSIPGFSKALHAILSNFPYLNEWKTFSIIGTSFPNTLAEIKQPIGYIPRNEWVLYTTLLSSLYPTKLRRPTFGDYAINHPQVFEGDLRILKPSANIRYTIDDKWCIVKGKSVRSEGYRQFHELSKVLIKLPVYSGETFSYGDKYIYDCAYSPIHAKCGNLTTWRAVGTNRHIEKVVFDIANLFSS